ncbi:hypothetical protein GC170_13115 [bacterium]|nr:hypothetical protein [bacterium]
MGESIPTGVYVILSTLAIAFVGVLGAWLYRWFESIYPLVTIHEYERAVRYVRGKLDGVSEPGQFRYRASTTELIRLDMREQTVIVPGQEILSSDSLGFKISLQANYRIADPVKSQTVVSNYFITLYADIHAASRAVVETMTGDEILANRAAIGSKVEAVVKDNATRYGIEIVSLTVRDCMLPGNLKQIYAKVAEAKQEGLAALERARGESAALRNLANAARAMENNPNLSYLRLLQTIEKNGGSSMFVLPPALGELVRPMQASSNQPPSGDSTH